MALNAEITEVLRGIETKCIPRNEVVGFDRNERLVSSKTWVELNHLSWNSETMDWPQECQALSEEGSLAPAPWLSPVPNYLQDVQEALRLKKLCINHDRQLRAEEVLWPPRDCNERPTADEPNWTVRIIDPAGSVAAQASGAYLASAIILAVFADLLKNDDASDWLEVSD